MHYLLSIHFTNRFFLSLGTIAICFIFGHFIPFMLIVSKLALYLFLVYLLVEIFVLFLGRIEANRNMQDKFSNGEANPVKLLIKSSYPFPAQLEIIDELPVQFQKRDFLIRKTIGTKSQTEVSYSLRPVERGHYEFGKINVFAFTMLGFAKRRHQCGEEKTIAVYPSFLMLKKTELLAFSNIQNVQGQKKVRKAGNNKEFEQIKEYVIGDDHRRINWKATARFNKLMVNEYQDERFQNVYQIIDMGRTMQMPFNGLSLLDYSINTALAISNVVLKKNDRIGLLSYSNKIAAFVQADNQKLQLNRILETLFAQKTNFKESNLEQVYILLKQKTPGRSLLIFYTNYESILSMERQLPLLRKLAQNHLLILVSFINTELLHLIDKKANTIEEIYLKTIAEKNLLEKELFMEKLSLYGIINLRVKPEELTIEVVNKYLEIKNRGLL